ncbi:MAG: hypothetical protein IKX98_00020 [Clostridia bacterium]|nr:hypothetical protein [Clostridia bacterium]
MAYRNTYNYKGGSKKVRDSRRVKRGLRIAGWTVLWLFVGMLLAHLIFSVAVKTKERTGELASEGIPPITTRRDEINSVLTQAFWCGGDFTDSYAVDEMISMLKRKGITEAVLDLKPESGVFAYNTGIQTARRLDAVQENAPDLDRILVKFANAGIGVIARVSLYVDDLAATDLKHCAVESREVTETETDEDGNEITVTRAEKTNVIWQDKNRHSWRSPFDSGAVDYAIEIIAELAEGGVKGVLFDNVRFPTEFDGDYGNVAFPDEETAELPRAGAVRQNVSTLHDAAQSVGVKLYVAIDATYCCGAQDARAGITFNVFDMKADVICPIMLISRQEADGVKLINTYPFDTAADADINELFAAFTSGVRMMQGAIDEPPAVEPVIQAYSDSARHLELSADDVKKELTALDKALINGRIIFGPRDELDRLVPDAASGEAAE